ncbi:MAG: alpha/beta fold hydrolase [Deltaproteobacteria bacterium]|nr:MAG: alpha/beta fold hydrolase [Deltaproteobacteria bacterium]
MKLSLKLHTGKPEMPVVLLIHGLGMNNYFWVDPEQCFVLGGLAPLTIFLTDEPELSGNAISFGSLDPHIKGLWNFLKPAGFSLASWTQSRPLGPIQLAIDELKTALDTVRNKWPGKTIYLIGHSRGGLIARSFLLEQTATEVEGLITICSPHSGTGMAKFSRYLKPAGVVLEKMLPGKSRTNLAKAISRVSEFLQSPAIEELSPESDFLASVKKPLPGEMRKLSFGGTSPALFQLKINLPGENHRIVKFPDLFAGVIPAGHLPKELTPGLGDALVSAESAKLPGSKHYNFPANHVKAAYDNKIQSKILNFLNS